MKIKKSLLAAATATAVAFGGASIATAQDDTGSGAELSSGASEGNGDILGSLADGDGILGSFVGDDEFDTIRNITAVISLIVAGFNLSNVIKLPKLPF